MIPDHQRKNYERTDEHINELNALLVAIDTLNDLDPKNADRVWTIALTRMARDKLETIERQRQMEWVGLGGSSFGLNEEEIAASKPSPKEGEER